MKEKSKKDYAKAKDNYERKFQKKIQFRVNQSELHKIQSKKGTLSDSQYAKIATLKSKISVKNTSNYDIEILKKLLKEMGMIGNNLNQIARNSNIEKFKQGGSQHETLEKLDKILPLFNQVLDRIHKEFNT